jgi:tetratricopeptide (TPR) repeat protein
VARVGAAAAGALEHAHATGVVHRDVKPGNLLVDRAGKLWVADFGLAKLGADAGLTVSGDLVGTLRYMSPEQALAKHGLVDHRTDVYALGATLYELLTGVPAVAGEDREEILRNIAFAEPVPPRRLDPAIPRDLETVVLKCLEKDPAGRYASAGELAADLRRFLADEPVRAKPPGLRTRLAKWAHRHRAVVWSAALVLVVTLTALAGAAGYVVRDRDARLAAAGQKVGEALAGARAAIEAGDLTLAGQRVGEADGHLGADRDRLPDAVAAVEHVRQESKDRQDDQTRFQQFQKQASDAQDHLSGDIVPGVDGDEVGERVAEDALRLYRVLEADDWLERLGRSTLTAAQKAQVRETAYVTLLSLADSPVRRRRVTKNVHATERVLELLRKAEEFHEPTRAFYFVRAECRRLLGDAAGAAEDLTAYRETPGATAWDYYLPGHTVSWSGDLDEAIRAYRKALAIQPDHYLSLFFLAERFATNKINRRPEAIQLFTGCIALRRNHVAAYYRRAECHFKLGYLADAEADYTAGIAAATTDNDRAVALAMFGHHLLNQGRYAQAEPLLRECLTIRAETSPAVWRHFDAQSLLGGALLGQEKYAEAEPLLRQGYEGMKQREAQISQIWKGRLAEAAERLARLCEATGRPEQAREWRAKYPPPKAPPPRPVNR